jgi:hypothetical protein
MRVYERIKKFFSDLFRANEQFPLIIASVLIISSFDLIKWVTAGQGATYQIPLFQAILIAALVVMSGMVFARWVIKWQWKSINTYLESGFAKEFWESKNSIYISIGFTVFLIWCYISVVTALLR